MIDSLIDKRDGFEIVRDQIAQILADETASQQALAEAAAKDSGLWKFRVYRERSNPWEAFLNVDENEFEDDTSPIVNVWFDNASLDGQASNVVSRQKVDGSFNIDIYGFAVSASDGDGHKPGDREAALTAQRIARLVRNVLMSDTYTYLALRGTVWRRWIQSITSFQPQLDGQTAQKVLGIRLVLNVAFNELSPQVTPETLEEVGNGIKQAADGRVIAQVDYSY